jgi:tetratricopeptide (TPR) repeat protein
LRLLIQAVTILIVVLCTTFDCRTQAQEATPAPTHNSSRAQAAVVGTDKKTLSGTPLPLYVVVDDGPFARITAITVAGKKFDGGEAKRVEVIREKPSAGRTIEPGRPGMELFANDQVRVGEQTRVTIAYLSDPSGDYERGLGDYTELVLDSGAQVRISNPSERQGENKKSKWRQYAGRVITATRGRCDVKHQRKRAIAKGTEFQFRTNADNSIELLVLEGEVQLEDGDFQELKSTDTPITAAVAQPAIKVACDQKTDFKTQVSVNNASGQPHTYVVSTAGKLKWFMLVAESSITLPPGLSSIEVKAQLDTTDLCGAEKPYEEIVKVNCSDCDDEKSKLASGETTREIEIVITKPKSLAVKGLQIVTVEANDPLPSVASTIVDERVIREALSLTDDAIVADQPSYQSPARMVRRYQADPKTRGEEFKKARFDAIWNRRADRMRMVGDIFLDWGEGARALQAYDKAALSDPSLEERPQFLIDRGEAARLVGNLGLAESYINIAQRLLAYGPEANSSKLHAEASLALGNIRLDKAWRESVEGDSLFKRWLEDAGGYYSVATSENNPVDVRAVALTNYAQYLRTRGTVSLAADNTSAARNDYLLAKKYLEKAQKLYPDYPYSFSTLGDIYTNLGNVEGLKGKKSNMNSLYKRADREYQKILSKYPDLVDAYIGLGTLNSNRGIQSEKAARDNYDRAIQNLSKASLRNVTVPNVKTMTKAVALEVITQSGLIPVIVNEGDSISFPMKHYVMTQSIAPAAIVTEGDKIILQLRVRE